MLSDYLQKVKSWISDRRLDLFVAVIIFLAGMGGFGLGRLSVLWQDKAPLQIIDVSQVRQGSRPAASSASARADEAEGKFVASKSGKYYHYPWCSGAQKISDSNKIWFATRQEAAAHGYKPAGNCPGL